MIYQYIQPSAHLQSFVQCYLLLHFKVAKNGPALIKSYPPCPEQCLTFNPHATLMSVNQQTGEVIHRTSNYLSGQQVSRLNLHLSNDYLMLKVVFSPGAMYQLFGIPLLPFYRQRTHFHYVGHALSCFYDYGVATDADFSADFDS